MGKGSEASEARHATSSNGAKAITWLFVPERGVVRRAGTGTLIFGSDRPWILGLPIEQESGVLGGMHGLLQVTPSPRPRVTVEVKADVRV
jgi:hypothetical protein